MPSKHPALLSDERQNVKKAHARAIQSTLAYMVLPGIWGRLKSLFTSGFHTSAYFMALIFYAVRLLPHNHPYTLRNNIGNFGLLHVIGQAGNNLRYSWKNMDQILVFFTIISGLFILFAQIILFTLALLTFKPVIASDGHAASDCSRSISHICRTSEQKTHDLAMIAFDHIFGLPGVFKSCLTTAEKCEIEELTPSMLDQDTNTRYPTPFHLALQSMLYFYSMGMFFIGVIILLYFATVVVSETAATGSPFGQRYNKTWIPLRIMLFFTLLTPMTSGAYQGMNIAQFLVFQSAIAGSNLASNSWDKFISILVNKTNEELTDVLTSAKDNISGHQGFLATPNIPELDELIQFMYVAKACQIAVDNDDHLQKRIDPVDSIKPYLVTTPPVINTNTNTYSIPKYLPLLSASYKDALAHSRHGDLHIYFGSHISDKEHPNYKRHAREKGNVWPICGRLGMTVEQHHSLGSPAFNIQEFYYELIKDLWNNEKINKQAICKEDQILRGNKTCTPEKEAVFVEAITKEYGKLITDGMKKILEDAKIKNGGTSSMIHTITARGWVGASLWYNRVADMNGKVTGAVSNPPAIQQFPLMMEEVASFKQSVSESIDPNMLFNPIARNTQPIAFSQPSYQKIASFLNRSFTIWGINNDLSQLAQGPFLAMITKVFGLNGMYDMLNDPGASPLAQLSALGKGMMAASLRNIGGGYATNLLSGPFFKQFKMEAVANIMGSFGQKLGYATLVMSFVLYYILPLMPFIYFFFAFSAWVKSIFEAIVAMPLWALSFIMRWDGEGIAGPGASNGVMFLFEIFLRPILIVFGLLTSIITFSAIITIMNDIFTIAISNIGGFDKASVIQESGTTIVASALRGPIDELFFSIVYVVAVYLFATSSFKLIDMIPNAILRWMNFSENGFQDDHENLAGEISSGASRSGELASSKLSGQTLSGSQQAALS